jgi:ABC-type glutathione transport system ATPase component
MIMSTTAVLTPTLLQLAARLGIGVEHVSAGGDAGEEAIVPALLAHRVAMTVRGGGCIALCGPSGSGKTRLLELLKHYIISSATLVQRVEVCPLSEDQSVIDVVVERCGGSLSEALDLLHSCGLAEGPLLLRCTRRLSEGQRARLAIALGMAALHGAGCGRAGGSGGCALVCDEWCATLDETTARGVSHAAARWCLNRRAALIVAGPRCEGITPMPWERWDVVRGKFIT